MERIYWMGGLEWFLLQGNVPAAGAGGFSFNITGWSWFMPIAVSFVLDNSAGATVAQGGVNYTWNGTTFVKALSPFTVAAGGVETLSFGIDNTLAQAAGFAQAVSLPKMPVVGEGTVSVVRQVAPANSVIFSPVLTLIGVRYRNKS